MATHGEIRCRQRGLSMAAYGGFPWPPSPDDRQHSGDRGVGERQPRGGSLDYQDSGEQRR